METAAAGPKPDLKIIVGGTEFEAVEGHLRVACPYFDTILSSSMKEQQTKTIEFPDKDPEEWKVVSLFFLPKSHPSSKEAKITMENVYFLVPWFHEFALESLLKECDALLAAHVKGITCGKLDSAAFFGPFGSSRPFGGGGPSPFGSASQPRPVNNLNLPEIENLAQILLLCNVYEGLKLSKETSLNEMKCFWQQTRYRSRLPSYETALSWCRVLLPILQVDEYREAIWPSIKAKFSSQVVQGMDPASLVGNDLFPHLLATEIYYQCITRATRE